MKILCINLDSRPDRWLQAQEEFNRVGLTVERFPACTGNNPVRAFNKSVYECMKLAKVEWTLNIHKVSGEKEQLKTEYQDLLLFEDDVVFDNYKSTIFLDLQSVNFLTIHLGCNIFGTDVTKWQMPTRHSVALAKLHNCWQSHATLYSAECVKYIIDNFPYWKEEYETEGCQIFDEWLRVNVLNQGRSYVMKPMICYQRPDFSDIWNVPADYTGAHKAGNEWLKKNL